MGVVVMGVVVMGVAVTGCPKKNPYDSHTHNHLRKLITELASLLKKKKSLCISTTLGEYSHKSGIVPHLKVDE